MPRTSSHRLSVKRAYDAPARSDGYRVLVDRIWPRGLAKGDAQFDGWAKDLAPSAELRKWFAHDPSKWTDFKRKYFRELEGQSSAVAELLDTCSRQRVTLVFAAKDDAHNNAVALKEYLDGQLGSQAKRPKRPRVAARTKVAKKAPTRASRATNG